MYIIDTLIIYYVYMHIQEYIPFQGKHMRTLYKQSLVPIHYTFLFLNYIPSYMEFNSMAIFTVIKKKRKR